MIRSTLTDRWQTTIPAVVRKALGLKPRQHLTYELRDDGVFIRPENTSLSDFYGCLANDVPPASKTEERQAAREARVHRYTTPDQSP